VLSLGICGVATMFTVFGAVAVILASVGLYGVMFRDGIASQLFDISPYDPLTYGSVALLLSGAAFVATVVPAVRATRVDPMIALRAE
jgi:ABC-type antimicrobial peptide transport system permease subunit